jgi:hypothetical protein
MSRFYGEVRGNGSAASRMGEKGSGMHGHIRGWYLGAKVKMWVNALGEDVCTIHLTGGSHDDAPVVKLGSFTRADVEKYKKGEKNETAI